MKGIPGVTHIIAVASGKGGVGKSTTAMNLAVALATHCGLRVGMLDADIYGPSQPRMFGVRDAKPASDGAHITPVLAHGIKVMSMGFLVNEATPTVWRGPMVQSALKEMLYKVMWSPLDVLVLDMPPGTGDTQLSIAQQVGLSGAVIVSTPQDIALIDARKGLEMFHKVQIPILGVVENMSQFICPHCGEASAIFSTGGAKQIATDLGYPLLAEIPLDLTVRELTDAGQPLVIHAPDTPAAAAYRGMAGLVWQQLQAQQVRPNAPVKIVIE